VFHVLVGGEARAAVDALPAAADFRRLTHPGIDDLRLAVAAERAMHGIQNLPCASRSDARRPVRESWLRKTKVSAQISSCQCDSRQSKWNFAGSEDQKEARLTQLWRINW
jgi:hypothetical protein